MKKLLLLVLILCATVITYAALPVAAALQIKQAVKVGDATTLNDLIAWEPVRASLKDSLNRLSSASILKLHSADEYSPKAWSLWSGLKTAVAPILIERMIDRSVNADGISTLQRWGQASDTHRHGTSKSGSENHLAPALSQRVTSELSKLAHFYNRLTRARFHTLTEVEFDVVDPRNRDFLVASRFTLQNYTWKLTSVNVTANQRMNAL